MTDDLYLNAQAFEQEGIDAVVSGATSFFDGSIDILVWYPIDHICLLPKPLASRRQIRLITLVDLTSGARLLMLRNRNYDDHHFD